MEEQPHILEFDHSMEAVGEVMKQSREVTVDCDGFRHLQQGVVLLCQSLSGEKGMPVHHLPLTRTASMLT